MALGTTFRRSIIVALDRRLSSAEQGQRVASVAKDALAELVRSGAASPVYTRYVDGRPGVPEEAVTLDGGNIAYLFSNIAIAAAFALSYAVERSPQASGRFKASWFIAVDGQAWTQPLAAIPPGSQVILTNREPYARKIETGGMRMSVPPGIVEATRQELQRRFPGLQVDRSFVSIPGGRDGRGGSVPYVLKGRGRESGLMHSPREGWGRRHAPRPARAKDRQAGNTVTYPAVVMSERTR